MSNIRNILLIGKTGNGKSTLANVITGTDKFKEGEYATSETKEHQCLEFDITGTKYQIIDTMGINDTKFSQDQVLEKLAEACWYIKEEVNQVLFVTSGRITEEEIQAYKLLRDIIFDHEVVEYTAVVRTNFQNFRKEKKCQVDTQRIIENGEELAEIFRPCKFIHVDNPAIDVEDEDEINVNKKKRENSRTILLEYLGRCDRVYKSKNLYKKEYDELETSVKKREGTIEELKKIRDELSGYIRNTKGVNILGNASSIIANASTFMAPIAERNSYLGVAMKLGGTIVSVGSSAFQENYEKTCGENFEKKLSEDKQNQKNISFTFSFLQKSLEIAPDISTSINSVKNLNKVAANANEESKSSWKIVNYLYGDSGKTKPAPPPSSTKLENFSTGLEIFSNAKNIHDAITSESSQLIYMDKKIEVLQNELSQMREKKDYYEVTMKNWAGRREELKDRIENYNIQYQG